MSLFEKEKMHLVLFVTRMVVMGFVRATCSRGGSVCKDWFDRAGKMVYWLTRNVLSVADFVWAKEGMELELPDGSIELDPLRGEVKLNRVKHHYHEAGYEYNMSVTADAVQAARRASWWIFLYQFCRGLFKVQYAEMSTEAIEAALCDRAENGYHGIMPLGARISAVSALCRWLAGERGYQPSLESEPFFVQPKGSCSRSWICGRSGLAPSSVRWVTRWGYGRTRVASTRCGATRWSVCRRVPSVRGLTPRCTRRRRASTVAMGTHAVRRCTRIRRRRRTSAPSSWAARRR